MDQHDANTQATKAAILLLAMGGSLGSGFIKTLATEEVKSFAQSASTVDEVDEAMLAGLVTELEAEMARSEPVRGGNETTRALLNEALSPAEVQKILGNEEVAFQPVWQQFASGAENTLTPYLLDQHPQTVTFILSKLEAELSARVMATLPRTLRDQVARRLLKLQAVSEAVSRIAQDSLRRDLLGQTSKAEDEEALARMAALLNRMEKPQVEEILESLRAERPAEAAALKKMLFSFEDVAKLPQKDRLVLFDKVQTEQVMFALRGSEAGIREIVLSSLGARARRMIEAELTTASPEVTKEVVAARQAIATTALKLMSDSAIAFPADDGATIEITSDPA
jgi:flagellar motor switch protein FliG